MAVPTPGVGVRTKLVATRAHDGQEADVSMDNPLVMSVEVHSRTEAGDAYSHNSVHRGLGAGQSYYHLLRTGAKPVHLYMWHASSDLLPIELELSEAPTTTADGAPAELLNKNRTSDKTSGCLVFEQPTLTARGLHIEGDLLAAGNQAGGSGHGISTQWMLAPSTDYLFAIDNKANQGIDFNFHIEFYVEDE